jgi:hypothetical protein
MLVDFQQKIRNILVAVGHSFQSFDFVVYAFGNGRGNPPEEVIQDKMPLAEEFLGKLHEGRDARPKGGGYPPTEPRTGNLSSIGPIYFQKLLFEQHASVHLVIKFGKLFEDITLTFGRSALHQNELFPTVEQIGKVAFLAFRSCSFQTVSKALLR